MPGPERVNKTINERREECDDHPSFAYIKNEVKTMKNSKRKNRLSIDESMADVLEALGTSVKD